MKILLWKIRVLKSGFKANGTIDDDDVDVGMDVNLDIMYMLMLICVLLRLQSWKIM